KPCQSGRRRLNTYLAGDRQTVCVVAGGGDHRISGSLQPVEGALREHGFDRFFDRRRAKPKQCLLRALLGIKRGELFPRPWGARGCGAVNPRVLWGTCRLASEPVGPWASTETSNCITAEPEPNTAIRWLELSIGNIGLRTL